MYATLGNITFEGMRGFTSFDASLASIIAEHPVINGKPKLQKTGDAPDSISFAMRFHYAFCTPEVELQKINQAVRTAEINPLLLGNGVLVGNFVIKSASTSWQQTDTRGNIREATVQVELIESSNALSVTQALSSAFASASNSPFRVVPATLKPSNIALTSPTLNTQPVSDAHVVGLGVSKATAISNGIDTNVASLQKNLGVAKATLNKVLRQCDEMKQTVNAVLILINRNPNSEVYNRTRTLAGRIPTTVSAIDTMITRVNNMLSALESGNNGQVINSLTSVVNGANDLKTQTNGIRADSTNVVSLSAGGR